jgi:hypothetical protein
MSHSLSEQSLCFLGQCREHMCQKNEDVANCQVMSDDEPFNTSDSTVRIMIEYVEVFIANGRLISGMEFLRKWYGIYYSSECDIMKIMGPLICEVFAKYPTPINTTALISIANASLPEYKLNIPWLVNYDNVNVYHRLTVMGFSPFVVEGSDNKLVTQIHINYNQWLDGTWTPVLHKVEETLDVDMWSLQL